MPTPTDVARLASKTDGRTFPYAASLVCYFERLADGRIQQLHYKDDFRSAVYRARVDGSTIFAVWPGEYRSDLFVIDDLDALAAARKL